MSLFYGAIAKENTLTNHNASEAVSLFYGAIAKENTLTNHNASEAVSIDELL
jgi:hypothetical protein